jgi:hypothetical protein
MSHFGDARQVGSCRGSYASWHDDSIGPLAWTRSSQFVLSPKAGPGVDNQFATLGR